MSAATSSTNTAKVKQQTIHSLSNTLCTCLTMSYTTHNHTIKWHHSLKLSKLIYHLIWPHYSLVIVWHGMCVLVYGKQVEWPMREMKQPSVEHPCTCSSCASFISGASATNGMVGMGIPASVTKKEKSNKKKSNNTRVIDPHCNAERALIIGICVAMHHTHTIGIDLIH